MAKTKIKRNSGLSDKVNNKKKVDLNKKKLNPFEVHINREKFKVLGQKSKHDRGLPGVSRAKAIQKRKETIGTEMKLMHKTNAFIDRRIGEKNNQLSSDDRVLARFAAERIKQYSKKNIYNLADDEILTHRGQTLEEIEKFDDPRSSDEEDEDGRKMGGLDDEFVSEGHFGGGVLSKTESKDGARSHKDLIEQLIAESKKRKAEKQKEKEQTLDLTEKLDTEWKDLQPVVFKRTKVEEPSLIDKILDKAEKRNEDYDRAMRELKFDRRGVPSDGLKNEEKVAKEEKQRLEKLEMEREMRMHAREIDKSSMPKEQNKHRSADDLDDNFELDDGPDFMLAYDKDGKPLVPEHIFKQNSGFLSSKTKFNEGISDSSDADNEHDENEESDDEKESSDEDDEEQDGHNIIGNDTEDKLNIECETDVKEKDQNMESDSSTSHKEKSIDDNDMTEKQNDDEKLDIDNDINLDNNINESEDEADDDMINFKDYQGLKQSDQESEDEIMENDEVEERISSFFDVLNSEGDNLKELLSGKTPQQQSLVLERLIKSYDPSRAENNKELLCRLYAHLLQYIDDLFSNLEEEDEVLNSFKTFKKIAPYMYDLALSNVLICKKYLCELLKKKHEDFKINKKRVPDLDTLIFFKLVSLLYATSDYRHPVATPCFVFMSEILTKCQFQSPYSISRGIFITSLLLEYTVLSKRLVPAAINFLRGILFLSTETSILNPIQVIPPFRLHKDKKVLVLEDDCNKMAEMYKMAAKDLVAKEATNEFKIRCVISSVNMLHEMFENFGDIECQECLFAPHIQLLNRLNLELYPKKVGFRISEVIQDMKQKLETKTFTLLTKEKKKPKALKLYEPDIQEVFTGRKHSKLPREKLESNKLKHKHKREMKGALREIRRDKAFIASVKIKQKIQSDNVRKEKVKQIYKEAAIQQGELNKLKRMK
ncbi:Nucleolar protein 14 [Eumeta japonica]|uniref:Nucleolar protein 14 n=1 Tax=Eumeta variegata TaxID=151549 RepID=A0A4C1YHD5_EUMVA|nr:Nucleolar protein 14 [Eumeta japonica]